MSRRRKHPTGRMVPCLLCSALRRANSKTGLCGTCYSSPAGRWFLTRQASDSGEAGCCPTCDALGIRVMDDGTIEQL